MRRARILHALNIAATMTVGLVVLLSLGWAWALLGVLMTWTLVTA